MFPPQPFDFTAAMRRLCTDVTQTLPEFEHVHMDRIAVTFAQARRRVPYGLQAKLTPLRFEGGALTTTRAGRNFTIQRWYDGEVELLYVLTFYLPRFLDQTFREKLITVMHELYHISPQFDGDIRRLQGRCHVHSNSQKEYDCRMERFVDRYLVFNYELDSCRFLKTDYRGLVERHGSVVGIRMPNPRLVPLSKSA